LKRQLSSSVSSDFCYLFQIFFKITITECIGNFRFVAIQGVFNYITLWFELLVSIDRFVTFYTSKATTVLIPVDFYRFGAGKFHTNKFLPYHTRVILGFILVGEIIYYGLQYFDEYDPKPIPVCLLRLTLSVNLGQFHSKMAVIQSILPALVYIVSLLLITIKYLHFKWQQNPPSNNLVVWIYL